MGLFVGDLTLDLGVVCCGEREEGEEGCEDEGGGEEFHCEG